MGTGPGCWRENRGFVVSPCCLSHHLLWRYQYLLSNRLPQMQAMLVHVHIFALAGVILDHHIFGVPEETLSKAYPTPVRVLFLSKKVTYLLCTFDRNCAACSLFVLIEHISFPHFLREYSVSLRHCSWRGLWFCSSLSACY